MMDTPSLPAARYFKNGEISTWSEGNGLDLREPQGTVLLDQGHAFPLARLLRRSFIGHIFIVSVFEFH
jgi:hypothetical protein